MAIPPLLKPGASEASSCQGNHRKGPNLPIFFPQDWKFCNPLKIELITPPKTNMTMEETHFFNRIYIFKCLFFHCHVSFRGCSHGFGMIFNLTG